MKIWNDVTFSLASALKLYSINSRVCMICHLKVLVRDGIRCLVGVIDMLLTKAAIYLVSVASVHGFSDEFNLLQVVFVACVAAVKYRPNTTSLINCVVLFFFRCPGIMDCMLFTFEKKKSFAHAFVVVSDVAYFITIDKQLQ